MDNIQNLSIIPNGAIEVSYTGIGVNITFESQEKARQFHDQLDESMKIKQNQSEQKYDLTQEQSIALLQVAIMEMNKLNAMLAKMLSSRS